MAGKILFAVIVWSFSPLGVSVARAEWNPPARISRDEVVTATRAITAMPDIKIKVKEDLFRLRILEMDWDLGAMVYEPEDPSRIAVGPDGRKVGIFLIHGGASDHRSKDDVARILAGKYGFKVTSMTYPGYLYLLDPSRNWPGTPVSSEPVGPDTELRMPIWNKDKLITRDQYDVVEDKSMMDRYGTLILACAKEGTDFYYRMAAYPVAFEEAAKDLMRRHLPEGEYSIYIHGHSTGGPFSFLLTQRVPNIVGVIGMENSPFGYIYSRQVNATWNLPFNCLSEFTWRITAMYAGTEVLLEEGPEALKHLPRVMEKVLDDYKKGTTRPQFKAEYPVHLNGVEALAAAAKATAKRLNLNAQDSEDLARRFKSYPRELTGKDVRPVPPILFSIAKKSPDHTYDNYTKIVLPMFAAMSPAPKVRLVPIDAGYHSYNRPEPGLPMGVVPAVVRLWHDAIMGGYYLPDGAKRAVR